MPQDAERIAELVDRHAAALRALAGKWSSTPDDLVQEAFCRLVEQRPPPQNPSPWLFQVVRNLARDQARRERRQLERETRVARREAVDVDPALAADARHAAALVERLAPESYEVVVMRLWGGLTLQETAAACGVSIATVHRRYHQALEELRQWMTVPLPPTEPSNTSRSNCS
jgi:RNA polymerase sigma-70 factor (ECF subfamily)